MLEVDWAATPLGPIDEWPNALATVVRVLLTSRFAMWMAWGPELTFLCNGAYRRDTLGPEVPVGARAAPRRRCGRRSGLRSALGSPTVLSTGQATWDEALMLILERSGYPEETYHTFSYSPLAADDGAIAGMLCVVSEDTQRVITQRRMSTLRELGSASSGVREEHEFLDAACAVLGDNPRSLPFTIIYLFDDGEAHLACSSGIEEGHPAAPAVIGHSATPTRRGRCASVAWVARRSSRSTRALRRAAHRRLGRAAGAARWCCRSSSRHTSARTGSSSPGSTATATWSRRVPVLHRAHRPASLGGPGGVAHV